jgi:hypothetical protein
VSNYSAFSSDGHRATWTAIDPTGRSVATETLTVTWENEGWTANGVVGREQVQYVIRLSATWQVRQFLLFRDLDEPDLWLATDGGGRWGEMNGAHRLELDGCTDLEMAVTPFSASLPIRRLPLEVGHTAEIAVAVIDVDTLDVQMAHRRYTRLDVRRWSVASPEHPFAAEFDVDEFGLVLDHPAGFRRSLA